MSHAKVPTRPVGEEIANSVTHGLGWVLAIVGLVFLVVFSARYGDVWHVVSCSIYGATLVFMYASSTLYHSLTAPKAKYVFRVIEHSAIYVLIAGTYTPITLVSMRGPWGWTIFGVIWGLAVLGILFKCFFVHKYNFVSTLVYVLMGWIIVLAAKPIAQNIAWPGVKLIILGGLSYTVGVIFYAMKRVPYAHALWHLFVLGGSVFHFFAILFYIIPLPS